MDISEEYFKKRFVSSLTFAPSLIGYHPLLYTQYAVRPSGIFRKML